jgi:hypothetical protein
LPFTRLSIRQGKYAAAGGGAVIRLVDRPGSNASAHGAAPVIEKRTAALASFA